MRLRLAIALSLALAAGGALAQTAPAPAPASRAPSSGPDSEPPAYDPIGDAIAASLPPDQTTDEEPDALPADRPAPTPPGYTPPPPPSTRYSPARPLVIAPSRGPKLDRPVMIDETGKSPDGPPTVLDLTYESRIRGSAAASQGLQGPLDGGWTVRTAAGAPVLSLQLVDRGQGYGQLEGAWRSLDVPVSRVGLIDSLDRQPAILTIRITRAPGKPTAVLSLTPSADGTWRGDLMDDAGVHSVVMKRN